MFPQAVSLTSAPEEKPVSLDEAKQHLRILRDKEDDLIERLIATATADVEGRAGMTGRALITQSWEARFNCWPETGKALELPYPPLKEVTSVKYLDTDGVEQTLDASVYEVDTLAVPGEVRLAMDQSWPDIADRPGAVRVAFDAGYGAGPEDVPEPIRQAILLIVGEFYQNRDLAEDPAARMRAVPRLLARFRLPAI
ncbi:MAG: head-tail connector protein [Dichotomicrobium sp.]